MYCHMQRFDAGGSQERAGDCGEKPRPGRDEKEKPNGDTQMIYDLLLIIMICIIMIMIYIIMTLMTFEYIPNLQGKA